MADTVKKLGNWRIVTQQEATDQNAAGAYVPGVRVGFEADGGLFGTVFVPNAQYGAQSVFDAVQERVRRMAEVQQL